jgi:hypothetical protein
MKRVLSLVILSLTLSAASPPTDSNLREFSGTWVYQFEGDVFVEGDASMPPERMKSARGPMLSYSPYNIDPSVNYDELDVKDWCYRIYAFLMKFDGYKSYGGDFLHPDGMIKVVRLISAKPLPAPHCDPGPSPGCSYRADADGELHMDSCPDSSRSP